MLTRCPACTTTFRVTPEQLKVRAGLVRCGRCDTRFNALDALQDEPLAIVAAQPVEQPVALAPAEPASVEPNVPDAMPAIETPVGAPQFPADAPGIAIELPAPAEGDLHSTVAAQADALDETAAAQTEPARATASAQRPMHHVSFDEWQGEAGTAPRRWPWILGALLMTATLLAQAALHYRVEIAVLQPRLKPLLLSACKFAGCTVSLPRKAEFLGIESSDLHPDPDHAGHLLLSTTLKNRAPFGQEFPLLEVTLNDVADHPLIIKDLKPEEYLPVGIRPAKGFGVNEEIAVNLTLDVGDVPAAGYRLYLFYP